MNNIQKQLYEEQQYLMELQKQINDSITHASTGKVRIAARKGKPQFYFIGKGDLASKGRYMRKCEVELVQEIVQREYDENLVKAINNRLLNINRLLKNYEKNEIINCYAKLNEIRRGIINTQLLPDEEYRRKWEVEEYSGKIFADGTIEIYSEKGERVRSKSEKIIADALAKRNIPYKYEHPLRLKNGSQIYPDFIVLDEKNRREVIWEHFGLMDNAEYVENVQYKIEHYQRDGFKLGESLIFTFECKKYPLESTSIIRTIEQYFG